MSDLDPSLSIVAHDVSYTDDSSSEGWGGDITSSLPEGLRKSFKVIVDDSRDSLLTEFGKDTMKDRYLLPGESYQDLFARVASAYSDDDAHAQRLYDYISKLWFMPATPVLSNGGTTRGMPISCYLNSIDDSLESIANTWNENIWLASRGGGIGTYLGAIRSIGENVGINGKTSGIVPFIKVMDSLTLAIAQGSLRRGSAAAYIDIHHPEIEEFLEIRKPTGDFNRKSLNIHHGVMVTDEFMEAVRNGLEFNLRSPKDNSIRGTVDARSLFQKLVETRLATGEPYIVFSDTVNRAMPEFQKKAGLKVTTSNLCVAPETRILTRQGYKVISDVAGTQQEVWNGKQWSWAQVEKTGENQKLVSVHLSNGVVLQVTEYHKWKLQVGYGNWESNSKLVETHELKAGDKLVKPNFSVVEAGVDCDPAFAYRSGFFTADGTQESDGSHPRIYLYGEKQDLLPIFEDMNPRRISVFENNGKRHAIYFDGNDLAPKYTVPLNTSVNTRLNWLAGWLDGDGTVARNGETETIQACSINLTFLQDVRLMLTTLGVDAKISHMRDAGYYSIPDGRGGQAEYLCSDVYRLVITAGDTQRLINLGFNPYRLKITPRQTQRDAHQFVTVVAVVDEGRVDDTYCFNEPLEHLGVFEGVLTGNCSEITLPTGRDHLGNDRTAVCCLSSLNLETWTQWNKNEEFIEDVMRFLDNVLQDYIDRAEESMVKARYSALRERSVGLGVMGFHTFLQERGIPFESAMAKSWNMKFFKHIKEQSDAASVKLAHERGACPDAADHDVMQRFACKTAIAPTASISIICGGASACIEPIPANVYTHKTLLGSVSVKNKNLEKVLDKYGKNTDSVWNSILENDGSVLHLDFLTESEKSCFKTSFEIDQRWLLEFAGDRASMIDQAQSLNLYIPADVDSWDLLMLHFQAWEKGIKSLYYLRSKSVQKAGFAGSVAEDNTLDKPVVMVSQTQYETCLACE